MTSGVQHSIPKTFKGERRPLKVKKPLLTFVDIFAYLTFLMLCKVKTDLHRRKNL